MSSFADVLGLPFGKVCTRCGEWKVLEDFYVRKDGVEGRASHCKVCKRAYARSRTADKAAYDKRYRKENLKQIMEGRRRRYQANRQESIATSAQWRKDNPDMFRRNARHYAKQYQARKKGASGSFTAREWNALCDRYGNICLCCAQAKPLTIDHVVPLSKGGCNNISNIQPLCHSCNSSKNDKIIDFRPTLSAVK